MKGSIAVFTQKSNAIDKVDVLLVQALDMTKSKFLSSIKKYKAIPIFVLSDKLRMSDFSDCKNIITILPSEVSVKATLDLIKLYFNTLNTDMKSAAADLKVEEKLLLKGLAQSLSDKEIARQYGLPMPTVKYYKGSLFKKLDVKNRAEAALIGQKIGV